MINCVEEIIKLYFKNLFTYNLACLNQILFGKECLKFDTVCLFLMETKLTTDSESPGWWEWEGQRGNFWFIEITSKKTFQFWLFFRKQLHANIKIQHWYKSGSENT